MTSPENAAAEPETTDAPSEQSAAPEEPSEQSAAPEEPSEQSAAPEEPSEQSSAPEEPSEQSTAPEEPGDQSTLKWFAVHTYSSFESKVKQAIEHRATLEDLRDQIVRVIIPTEMIIEIKGGKKRTVPRNLMPGYVLVEMEPLEECFNLIKDVKGVSSFVGDGHRPAPLSPDEVQNLIDIMEDKREKPKPKMQYSKGDQIKVIEGPFNSFVGQIDGIDEEKGKLRVMVSIFGRPTALELDVLQVEPA